MGDEGAKLIFRSLKNNATLTKLNMGSKRANANERC